MKLKKGLIYVLLILMLLPLAVKADGLYGNGSQNTSRGGYGSSIYFREPSGSFKLVNTGSTHTGGNLYVGSSFLNAWGSMGINYYLGNGSNDIYLAYPVYQRGDCDEAGCYATKNFTVNTSGLSQDKAYAFNFDTYGDDGDQTKMGAIKVKFSDTDYMSLQQAINAGRIEPMVLISSTGGAISLSNILNGSTASAGMYGEYWSSASVTFITKANQLPTSISWSGVYGEWLHYEGWTTTKGVPVVTPKSSPTITAPTGLTKVYNGSNQTIYNAGSSNSEAMQYSFDNSTWSTSIAQKKNVGNYNLYYKVNENSSYTGIDPTGPVVAKITPASLTVNAPDQTYTYNGQAQGKGITASTVDGTAVTIKYGTSNGSYTLDAAPKITNVSESNKTIYYKVSAPNHADYTGQYKLIMNPRDINEASASDIQKQIYSGNALTPAITLTDLSKTLAENTDFTKEYSSNKLPLGTSSGKGTITITGKGNYYKTKTINFDIEAKKVNISFNPLGGTEVAAVQRYYGMPYGDLTPSTRIGYNFTSWNNARTDGDVITKDTYVTNPEDHMLFARWEIITYTLTYELYGIGHLEDPVETFNVEDFIDLPIPVSEGDSFHTFENWHLDGPDSLNTIRKIKPTETIERIQSTGTGDLIVHAKWIVNKYEGNIRAYATGGEEIKNEEVRREYYNTALYHLEYKLEGGETTCEVDLVED